MAGDSGRNGLDKTIADNPAGHKAADFPVVPAEYRGHVHRQRHYKPHVPGTEQEHSGGRQHVDGPAFGQDLAELWLGLALAQVLPQQEQTGQPHQPQRYRHEDHRTGKPGGHQQHAAQKESHPFQGVLGAGQNRHPLVQGALLLVRYQQLDTALGGHLVEVFGNTRQRLCRHHPGHREHGGRHGQHGQCNNLQEQPDIHGAVQAHPGAEIAAHQVGHHPEELVEDEQQGDFQGRIAQLVKVQHHQHSQGAIGQCEGPVVAGDHQVLANGGIHIRPGLPCAPVRRCGWRSPIRCHTRRRFSHGCR